MKKSAIGTILLMSIPISAFGWDLFGSTRKVSSHYADPYPGVVTRKFIKLPVGAVRPEGWLKSTLEVWASGITGHLHEYRSDTFWNTWDNRRSRSKQGRLHSWWPFEQQGYWADGVVQLAYILDDERLKSIADELINKILAGQNADGYMGCVPDNPYSNDGDVYVQSQLTLSLMSYYSATKDPRIIRAMQKGLKHIYENCKPLPVKKGQLARGWVGTGWPYSCHIIDAALWLYSKTGDRQMMNFADLIHRAMQEIPSDFEIRNLLLDGDTLYDNHGVDVGETIRIPAMYYLYSGNSDDLNASIKGLDSVDRYHGQVHGGPASDEHIRETGAVNCTEFCTHTVFNYTRLVLFAITGDVKYADAVERTLFNVGQGAAKPDGKAIQYYTAPNQVVCTRTSCNAADLGPRNRRQLFRPDGDPEVQCCIGESTRLYPNYVRDMWFASPDYGLAAACYGPCTVSAKAGRKGKIVTIEEKTKYPFEEKIHFVIKSSESIKFPLYLRIPGWCKDASIKLNGKLYTDSVRPGRMVTIDRLWACGDEVELNLPMKIRFVRGDKASVAVERGPLVYGLKIKHNWKKVGERFPGFPDWQVSAGSDWNYALCLKLGYEWNKNFPSIARSPKPDWYFTIKYPKVPESSYPWEYPPIELVCKGKKVDGWELIDGDVTPDVPQSLIINDNPEEDITLVPYGCAPIRITYFPVAELKRK